MRATRNRVYRKLYRGFEPLHLRQEYKDTAHGVFFLDVYDLRLVFDLNIFFLKKMGFSAIMILMKLT